MSDPYVPQVGHLVEYTSTKEVFVVVKSKGLLQLASQDGLDNFFSEPRFVTFLADRSKEWEALFQLDTLTHR